MRKRRDPDAEALFDACNAIERSSTTQIVQATVRYLLDRYIDDPPPGAWWADPDGEKPEATR